MPHGCHIYANKYDMAKATICAYPQSDHALPHWKCVLKCCVKCSSVNITDQEKYAHCPDTSPSIRFHIYHPFARCITHGRLLLTEENCFCKCKRDAT